jgi:integrase
MASVRVRVNRHGYLAWRFYGVEGFGEDFQVGTNFRDESENRKLLEAHAAIMRHEMKVGTFDFAAKFPVAAAELRAQPPVQPTERPRTVQEFAERLWLPKKKPPLVRASRARDYLRHCGTYIFPALGTCPLEALSPETLEEFRAMLVGPKTDRFAVRGIAFLGRSLGLKTARNVIDGTLRAMWRDARLTDRPNPFEALRWPRMVLKRRDPFTEDERDRITEFFQNHPFLRHYFLFVYLALWVGLRPSELCGLRRGDVDLEAGRLTVSVSRTNHEDNATKTAMSARCLDIDRETVALLKAHWPENWHPNDFLFLNTEGRPVHGESFTRNHWKGAIRALGIRPRDFYACRHTFISVSLTNGMNPKFIAEYCGTSLAMIEKHYGRYIRNDGRAQLALNRRPATGTVPDRTGNLLKIPETTGSASARDEFGRPDKLLLDQ